MSYKEYIKESENIAKELLDIDLPDITYNKGNFFKTVARADVINNIITVSKKELEFNTRENLINAIIHEIFHVISPKGCGHTGDWLEYSKIFNKSKYAKKYGIIERLRNTELVDKYTYLIKCRECDYFSGFYNKSKRVKNYEDYCCPECKSLLDLYGPLKKGKRKKYKREKEPKYIIICKDCGITYYRYAMSDFVKDYKEFNCGKCDGSFERVK